MRAGNNFGRYLQPPLTASRLDRQWHSIARLLGRLRSNAPKVQASGDIVRCVRARDAHRSRIPHGMHAALIRKRCGAN